MGETKWTKEQLEAITEKDCNLLVAAAAGAGKTAVLVERIIRKITCEENPVDIDRLLIVTFTNAAATEMRERIADGISKALDKKPNSKILQRQLALLSKANIMTIHSFCLEVIKSNFHYIGLNSVFRIADETEALLMKMETLDDLFEDIYDGEVKNEFFDLLECYGSNRDDQGLKDMVLTLYEFVQSCPWPEDWLAEKTEYFNLNSEQDFTQTQWGKLLLKNTADECISLKGMMEKAISVIESSEELSPYLANFQEEMDKIDLLSDKCCTESWDNLYEEINSFKFERLPRCKKDADKSMQEYVKSIRDDVKGRIKKIQEDVFIAPSRDIIEDLNSVYPLIKHLSELVVKFSREYAEKKREKSLLDFNDLEHFCLAILTEKKEDGGFLPSKIAGEYKERFEEIFVDEYQDSNLVQEIILNVISRKDLGSPNIFMVGDVKQSIYRFRQARPELFLEKYNTYSSEQNEKYRKIQLYKNFRSRKEVIDSVNFIFSRIMSVDVGELDYTEDEGLNLGAVYEEPGKQKEFTGNVILGGATELHIIETEGDEDGYKTGTQEEEDDFEGENNDRDMASFFNDREHLDSIQCEARVVAKRIKELVNNEKSGIYVIYDKNAKKYRPVEYRDIVILLRATRNWSDVFVEELTAQGIPVYADTGTGFFKTVEVQIILSLLQIIDNPLQDISLLSVLRSPIVLFTPHELTDIRLADRDASLYEALKKLAGAEGKHEFDKNLVEKVTGFLEILNEWRDKALYMSTDELIWYLYTETGFYSYVGAMTGGEQRQANLRMLFEQARKFEDTSYKGLFNFINFVNKLRSSRSDMGSAKILGENENVVRIMSIHKSKGLEFPVVILSGLGKGFNLQDLNRRLILHQELGFGPDYVDYKKRIAYTTPAKQALRYRIKTESLSEEMRILYVGFTRAREKLILTGSVKGFGKAASRWKDYASVSNEKIPGHVILRGRNYLDWVCSALGSVEQYDNQYHIYGKMPAWDIRVWNKKDVLNEETPVQKNQQDFFEKINEISLGKNIIINSYANVDPNADTNNDVNVKHGFSDYFEEINRRLNWEYKYIEASRIPVKISVTELKRRYAFESFEEYSAFSVYTPTLIERPAFMEESKGLSAAEIGTVLHFVMQRLDLNQVSTPEQIKSQVDEMIKKDLLTIQQADTVNIRKINNFFTSQLGKRMLNAEKVYREVPFNMQVSSKELFNHLDDELYKDEPILLQGVIDCFFKEPDGLVLLDYKTDYIPSGIKESKEAVMHLKERYKLQIEYYAKVLERLLKKKVKERYIYLFWNEEVVEFM
jgi:ATP-dependent helicase/nuclease subunit A